MRLKGYIYTALVCEHCLALLHNIGSDTGEHLKAEFGTAGQHSESYGNRQADHAGAGNPDTHGVLDNVAAETTFHALHGIARHAEQLGGTGGGEGNGHRFGTAHSGHNFALDKRQNTVFENFVDHGCRLVV